MQSLLSESVQARVRPHSCENTYYADEHNSKVQCFPSTVENRFVTGLPSLQSNSSSTVTFNPDGLVTDIVLTMQMPQPAIPTGGSLAGEGLGLTRGWGYQLIDSISVRYAGSSLYYFQGEQELIAVLGDCEDSVKRDQMLALGGAEITKPADWANDSLRSCSIYIKLPHNSPDAQSKPIGFPTSDISAPLQIQVKFKPFANVFLESATTGATLAAVQATIPTSLASATVQFKQAHLNDRSDTVSARENLAQHALSVPLRYFMQSQFSAPIPSATPSVANINLTGFRSGSVQGIYVWAVRNSDITPGGVGNPLNYVPLQTVELAVNGLVYFTARNNSAQIWDLVEKKCASAASTTTLAWNSGSQQYTPTAAAMYWTWIPLAQGVEFLRDQSMLSNGLGIANSVVSLTVDTGLTNTACTLYAAYLYNSTLLVSGGSADFTF